MKCGYHAGGGGGRGEGYQNQRGSEGDKKKQKYNRMYR